MAEYVYPIKTVLSLYFQKLNPAENEKEKCATEGNKQNQMMKHFPGSLHLCRRTESNQEDNSHHKRYIFHSHFLRLKYYSHNDDYN